MDRCGLWRGSEEQSELLSPTPAISRIDSRNCRRADFVVEEDIGLGSCWEIFCGTTWLLDFFWGIADEDIPAIKSLLSSVSAVFIILFLQAVRGESGAVRSSDLDMDLTVFLDLMVPALELSLYKEQE